MKIPVVLSVVHVVVDADGSMHLDLDGTPHNTERLLTRADLGSVIDMITTDLGEGNHGIRILPGTADCDEWAAQDIFGKNAAPGNARDRRPP